jgi:hypothetical protein
LCDGGLDPRVQRERGSPKEVGGGEVFGGEVGVGAGSDERSSAVKK